MPPCSPPCSLSPALPPSNAAPRYAWDRAHQARADGDPAEARRWLERAHRLAPADPLVRLTLGSLLLEQGEPSAALPLLGAVQRTAPTPAGALAFAACLLALDDPRCPDAMAAALQSAAHTPPLAALATRIAAHFGLPGWCALDLDGRVRTHPARATIALDGSPIRAILPPGWQQGRALAVANRHGPFLGSPLPIQRLTRLDAIAELRDGHLSGLAYHPADPDRTPLLLIRGQALSTILQPTDPADAIPDLLPLARPRRFDIPVALLVPPLTITDAQSRPILGSPLAPVLPLDPVPPPPAIDLTPRAVEIVIPVYRDRAATLACLGSVFAHSPAGTIVHVIDDASPDPALVAALLADPLFADARIRLHRHPTNRGFPAAANTGIRAAAGSDVVLLNSDTLVPPGWLPRFRRAAYAAPDIATATPLSNDATIASYPDPAARNPPPSDPAPLDRLAQLANPAQIADLPVGIGFCLYLRRDALDQIGLFREDAFAQGYGEESDYCRRAAQAGWRHVAPLDLYVAHLGSASFGAPSSGGATAHLRTRNQVILERLHPGYHALVAAHIAADPLLPARRHLDQLRFAQARAGQTRAGPATLLVSHDQGGGTAELVATRQAALAAAGHRPILLRPTKDGCQIGDHPNLRFAIPDELDALADLLRPERPATLEIHHLLGHHHALLGLASRLAIPTEFWIHDAASFCPRIALIGRDRRYCGEPDLDACERCVATLGTHLREPIGPRALVARSAADFAAASRIVVPTADAARRLTRHFPAARPDIHPWEDDSAWPAPRNLPINDRPITRSLRVCAIGALGVEKGFDILRACAEDARHRALPIDFVLCGHAEDDAALLDAGIFVTGPYAPADAVDLIARQHAHIAFIPSIWPETWCFALSRAWQAGLYAVAFDLGAQAERIRATGRGARLPLALPPPAINDALLRLARQAPTWHPPQP